MRLYHEGAVASIMIAGIDLSFAVAMLTPGKGRISKAMIEHDLVEVWVLVFLLAAAVTIAGVLKPHTICRKISFKLNALVCFSTYAALLFTVGGLATSAFGNVMLLTGACSLILLWMDEREDVRRRDRRQGVSNHARQT